MKPFSRYLKFIIAEFHDQDIIPHKETILQVEWGYGRGFLFDKEALGIAYSGRMGETEFFTLFN